MSGCPLHARLRSTVAACDQRLRYMILCSPRVLGPNSSMLHRERRPPAMSFGYLPGVVEAVAALPAPRTPAIARIATTLIATAGMAAPAATAALAATVVAPGVYALPGQGGEIG